MDRSHAKVVKGHRGFAHIFSEVIYALARFKLGVGTVLQLLGGCAVEANHEESLLPSAAPVLYLGLA